MDGGATATVSVLENTTTVTNVESTDPDGDTEGSGLTYNLTGGTDQTLFNIDPNTGDLSFITAPDFETPTDADGNNDYEVEVTVTDSDGNTDVQTLTVNVTDVNETDTDGDGVPDTDDIDDDNDGILDANEGLQLAEVPLNFLPTDNLNSADPTDIQQGNVFVYRNAITLPDGTQYDITLTFDEINGSDNDTVSFKDDISNENHGAINIANFDPAENDYVIARYVITEAGSSTDANPAGTEVPFAQIRATARDTDANEGTGFANADTITPGSRLVDTATNSSFTSPTGFTTYEVDATGEGNATATDPDFHVVAEYSDTSTVDFIFGTTRGTTSDIAGRNSGLVIEVLLPTDTDSDGIADHLDLDSDNDGISDLVESGQNAATNDTNNDGIHDSVADAATAVTGDTDNDGLADVADGDNGGTDVTPVDSETVPDGIADYIDLDSDNDGIPDIVEAQPTTGYTGSADGDVTDQDADGDGVIDIFDSNDGTTQTFGGTFATPNDDADDADGIPDYLDTDSDGDGIDDTTESGLTPGADTNGDGIGDGVNASYADPDGDINAPLTDLTNTDSDTSDADYRSLNIVPSVDTDGDGVTDDIDIDDDNDGILDRIERLGPESINEVIFLNDSFGNLLRVDNINGTPVLSTVGNMGISGTIGDIGLAPDGTLYATNGSELYSVDTATANATLVGSLPFAANTGRGLSFDGDGFGYVGDSDSSIIYRFDPSNLAGISVWHDVGSGFSGGDYIFIEDKVYVAWDNTSNRELRELTLDANGNVATDTILGDLPTGTAGLATDATGTLYALTATNPGMLYRLDLSVPPVGGVLDATAIPEAQLPSGLGFGATSNVEGLLTFDRDTDGDGIFDHLDLDSDNDGISDLVESGQDAATVDTNNDGIHDSVADAAAAATGDTDNDGLADVADGDNGGTDVTPIDSETVPDGIADYIDLDSDNDGIPDIVEAQPTAGYTGSTDGDVTDQDADGDGVIDIFDSNDSTTQGFGGSFATPNVDCRRHC